MSGMASHAGITAFPPREAKTSKILSDLFGEFAPVVNSMGTR